MAFTFVRGIFIVAIMVEMAFYSQIHVQALKNRVTNQHDKKSETKTTSTTPSEDASKHKYFSTILGSPKPNITINERGIWSGSDLARYHAIAHASGLSKNLVTFFKQENATSVLDLGGGTGQHVANLIQHGIFASCIDGNPEAQIVSNGTCSTMDLTRPMNLPTYDWVISFSVGRQIPLKYEDDFVENLDKLNKKGIIIYWGDDRPLSEKSATYGLKTVRSNAQVIAKFGGLGTYYNDPEGRAMLLSPEELKSNYSVVVLRKKLKNVPKIPPIVDQNVINLAVVSCGTSRMNEALTLIKSAILFSQHTALKVYAFTDEQTLPEFTKSMIKLKSESEEINANFEYEILKSSFPPEIKGMTPWSKVFKPCSLQRLFLPTILPDVDSLIYLDADTVVLSNLTELWNYFKLMNDSQFIALSQFSPDPKAERRYYKKIIPQYSMTGLNCGVSLMNLTRMRQFGFEDHIYQVRRTYEHLRPKSRGDQFLQNILYGLYPEVVYEFPCSWNLRSIHCFGRRIRRCVSGLENGVSLVHGTGNAFTIKKRQPFMRHIYEMMMSYNFKMDNLSSLLKKLQNQFDLESKSNTCFFKSSNKFYTKLENYAQQLLLVQEGLN